MSPNHTLHTEVITLEYIHWRNSPSDPVLLTGYAQPNRRDLKRVFSLSLLCCFPSSRAAYDEIKGHADDYIRFRENVDKQREDGLLNIKEWQALVNVEWSSLRDYLRHWKVIREPFLTGATDNYGKAIVEHSCALVRKTAEEVEEYASAGSVPASGPSHPSTSSRRVSRSSSSTSLRSGLQALGGRQTPATIRVN
jgi:hypothetical protein